MTKVSWKDASIGKLAKGKSADKCWEVPQYSTRRVSRKNKQYSMHNSQAAACSELLEKFKW